MPRLNDIQFFDAAVVLTPAFGAGSCCSVLCGMLLSAAAKERPLSNVSALCIGVVCCPTKPHLYGTQATLTCDL